MSPEVWRSSLAIRLRIVDFPQPDGPSRELNIPFAISNVMFSRTRFFSQAEDGIRDLTVTGVQTCALPICFRGRLSALPPGHWPGHSRGPGVPWPERHAQHRAGPGPRPLAARRPDGLQPVVAAADRKSVV